MKTKVMSMEEVLEQLLDRARLETEEAQRQLVAAQSGLAGLALLRVPPHVQAATDNNHQGP